MALSCQPLDFIRNFIWKVCLSWVCTVHHHFKMSCRWKSFKLSCMEKKNKSQKRRFYFCRVIGRSIKTWLIFTITCSTWLAVCWEMLRGINSGERDKVESLIDPQIKLFTFSANSIAPNRKISLLHCCCWKRKKKKNFLYMCRIWIKNQEAGIVIVGEDHVKELYKIICFWLKKQLKNKKQSSDNVSLVFSSIINLK